MSLFPAYTGENVKSVAGTSEFYKNVDILFKYNLKILTNSNFKLKKNKNKKTNKN